MGSQLYEMTTIVQVDYLRWPTIGELSDLMTPEVLPALVVRIKACVEMRLVNAKFRVNEMFKTVVHESSEFTCSSQVLSGEFQFLE